MSSRLLQVLLALSLLLNTFVLVGFVYRSWIAPPTFEHPPPPPPPGQRPSAFESVTRDLELDDAQRQALKPVFDRYASARQERVREIQKLREQMVAEYKKPSVDLARVDELIDKLTKLRAEFEKDTLHSLAQVEGQLKPDQRERMNQILAERLATPFGRQPGRPPGPPGPPGGPPGPPRPPPPPQ
jgi:Spy/CpxP family protein refolding chaperone